MSRSSSLVSGIVRAGKADSNDPWNTKKKWKLVCVRWEMAENGEGTTRAGTWICQSRTCDMAVTKLIGSLILTA